MPITAKLTAQQIRAIEEEVKRRLVEKAVAQKIGGVVSAKDVVVRDILPSTDLGFTNEVWEETISTANSWTTLVNTTVSSDKCYMFFGVKNVNASPKIVALKFSKGAVVKDIWHFQDMLTEPTVEAISDILIFYGKEEPMKIEYYAQATGTDNLIIRGFVAEPRGKRIAQE